MNTIHRGRYTARDDRDITVFLIGMRVNNPLRPDRWMPVATAFPAMLKHLAAHPESGLLGYHLWFGRITHATMYWRSLEDLMRFATDTDAPHLAAWRDFNRRARKGHVGIWHETYRSTPATREAIYVNMPSFGLGKATSPVPVPPGMHSARQRMAAGGTATA